MKRIFVTLLAMAFLLAACTPAPQMPKAKYEVYCRTHARTATYTGSPDENIPYLECMKIKGMHEVEVKEIQP